MATRNTAPTLSLINREIRSTMNNDFGGYTLSTHTSAAARKAAADNTAFQARIENLKQGNVPIKSSTQPKRRTFTY